MFKLCLLALLPALTSSALWNLTIARRYGTPTNFGNLIVTNGTDSGLVCSRGVNGKTADYLCGAAGYYRANNWTQMSYVNYWNRIYWSHARSMDFILDSVDCKGNNGTFEEDCSFKVSSDCSVYQALILDCVNEEEDYDDDDDNNEEDEEDMVGSWNFTIQRYYGSHSNYGNVVANNGSVEGLICDDGMTNYTADYLCKAAGYRRANYWTYFGNVDHTRRLNYTKARQIDFAMDELNCHGRNGTFLEDCRFNTWDDCSVYEALVLECVNEEEDEREEDEDEDEDDEDMEASWTFSIRRYYGRAGNRTEYSNFGNVVANNGSVEGLICDDRMTDYTADYLCKAAGYHRANYWTKMGKVDGTRRLSYTTARQLDFAMDELNCQGRNGTFLEDCRFNTWDDCSVYEALVLECVDEEDLDGKFSLQSGKGMHWRGDYSDEGVGNVVVNMTDGSTAMVCLAENYNSTVLDYLCRQNGYVSGLNSTSHRQAGTNGVNCDWAAAAGIQKVTMDLRNCDASAMTSSECTWGSPVFTDAACNIDDTIVVGCSSTRYEITRIQVLANSDGSLYGEDYSARTGTVVATVSDLLTGDSYQSLLKSKSGANSYSTGSALCRKAGYSYGYFYRQSSMSSSNKLSCGFIEEHEIGMVVSDYKCNSRYSDAFDCEYETSSEKWDMDDAMTVKCYGTYG